MSIFKKLKQAAVKEVIGSTLKSSVAPATFGKKSKAAAVLLGVAATVTAVAEYL